jgi:hypothetical protein
MAQSIVIVATLTTIGALGGLAYLHASRSDQAKAEVPSTAAATATESTRTAVEAPPVPETGKLDTQPTQPVPVRQITTDDVTRWVAETQSNDAKSRAAAIEALANAPKARAIPALERVLESGDPQVDRQIALRSLHTLALKDGDDTGAIRDVIRHAMYHTDDEAVTQSAQAFLEDIEAALTERAASASN